MESTVDDELRKWAGENNVPSKEYIDVWLGARVTPSVSDRYRRLIGEVVFRLLKDWDEHAEWSVEPGSQESPRGYASTHPIEEEAGATGLPYVIQIYPSLMDGLFDVACMWPLAHEFAHVASKLPAGSIVIKRKPYTRAEGDDYVEAPSKNAHEDAADQIALAWGFDREMQAWLVADSVSS